MLLAAGLFTFASCESNTESRTERVGNDIEEGAQEAGEEIEEGAEEVEDEIEHQ